MSSPSLETGKEVLQFAVFKAKAVISFFSYLKGQCQVLHMHTEHHFLVELLN